VKRIFTTFVVLAVMAMAAMTAAQIASATTATNSVHAKNWLCTKGADSPAWGPDQIVTHFWRMDQVWVPQRHYSCVPYTGACVAPGLKQGSAVKLPVCDEGVESTSFSQEPGNYDVCGTWNGSAVVAYGTQLLEDNQVTDALVEHGDVYAAYFEGIGISCDNPPAGYVDTGTRVTQTGSAVPGLVDATGTDQRVYELFVRAA
jgi:hypothetical protein